MRLFVVLFGFIMAFSFSQISSAEEIDVTDVLLKYKNSCPVLEAARANDLQAVELLLAHGANPGNALRGAIEARSLSLVRYLVEEAGVSVLGTLGRQPSDNVLDFSVGWWEGFDYFVSQGAILPNKSGNNLLSRILGNITKPGSHFSAEDIRQLRMRGAKINWLQPPVHTNMANFSQLFSSKFDRQKRIDIFNAIAEFGPQRGLDQEFIIDRKTRVEDWMVTLPWEPNRSQKRCTPILAAILQNDVELVRALLNAGASANDARWYSARVPLYSPLELAIRQGNRDIIALLVEYKAKL